MTPRNFLAGLALAAGILVAGSVPARAQGFSVSVTVDENGNGLLTNTSGFSQALPWAMAADPGPGGLPSALTYDLLNPPGLVAGDLLIFDPNGSFEDVVRFNPTSFTGGTGSLVFYSSPFDGLGFDSRADTLSPPGAFYANQLNLTETVVGGVDTVVYTPIAGEPGFVAGASGPVTYTLLSSVPEPSTLTMGGIASLAGLAIALWRRKRATA